MKSRTETDKFENYAEKCGEDDDNLDLYFDVMQEREGLIKKIEDTINKLKNVMNQTMYNEKKADAIRQSFGLV